MNTISNLTEHGVALFCDVDNDCFYLNRLTRYYVLTDNFVTLARGILYVIITACSSVISVLRLAIGLFPVCIEV